MYSGPFTIFLRFFSEYLKRHCTYLQPIVNTTNTHNQTSSTVDRHEVVDYFDEDAAAASLRRIRRWVFPGKKHAKLNGPLALSSRRSRCLISPKVTDTHQFFEDPILVSAFSSPTLTLAATSPQLDTLSNAWEKLIAL